MTRVEQVIAKMRRVHEFCVTRCNGQMDAERAEGWAAELEQALKEETDAEAKTDGR